MAFCASGIFDGVGWEVGAVIGTVVWTGGGLAIDGVAHDVGPGELTRWTLRDLRCRGVGRGGGGGVRDWRRQFIFVPSEIGWLD